MSSRHCALPAKATCWRDVSVLNLAGMSRFCLRSVTVGTTQTEVAKLEQMLLNGSNIAAVRGDCVASFLQPNSTSQGGLARLHGLARAGEDSRCAQQPQLPLCARCAPFPPIALMRPQMVPGSEASPFREPAE